MVSSPQYISENIMNTLAHTEKMYVHSVFNNGINLKASDRLIYIGLTEGPSAIKVSKDTISTLVSCKENDEVIVGNLKIRLKSINLVIDVSKSQIVNYHLNVDNISLNTIERLERIISGYNFMTGFDIKTVDLIVKLENDFDSDLLQYLDYLIGRGRGLTPSGDDFILGLLVYNNIYPFLSDEFLTQLKERLKARVTTDISINFLHDALNGFFVKEIIELVEAMNNEINFIAQIYNIANFGHTSGIDMLSGILAAINLEKKLRRVT